MQGKRIYPDGDSFLQLKEGEYGIDPRDKRWYCSAPGKHFGCLDGHEVTEHDDGTITVSPSILITTTRGGKKIELYHGFLKQGVWT